MRPTRQLRLHLPHMRRHVLIAVNLLLRVPLQAHVQAQTRQRFRVRARLETQ